MISDQAWQALKSYDWPGNVRELRNVIERCVLFSDGADLPVRWLQLPGPQDREEQPRIDGQALNLPLDGSMSLEDMDRFIVQTALERTNYNMTAAARNLGTTRQTLRYRAQKYDLKAPDSESAPEKD